jgi:hypothetical protein
MVIPKHRVCDLCGQEVGYGNRYYIIKSKYKYRGLSDNRKHDVCVDCIDAIISKIIEEEGGGE